MGGVTTKRRKLNFPFYIKSFKSKKKSFKSVTSRLLKYCLLLFLFLFYGKKSASHEIFCLFPMTSGLCPLEVTQTFLLKALKIANNDHHILSPGLKSRGDWLSMQKPFFVLIKTLGPALEERLWDLSHVWRKQLHLRAFFSRAFYSRKSTFF